MMAQAALLDTSPTVPAAALVDGLLETLTRGACEGLTLIVGDTLDLYVEEDRTFGRVLSGSRAEGKAAIARIAALAGLATEGPSWSGEGSIVLAGEPAVVVACRLVGDPTMARLELRARRAGAVPAEGLPRVPGYRVLRLIGRGATAEVYEARHVTLGRTVAIKVLQVDPAGGSQPSVGELFIGSRATHPNLVEVFDAGTLADGRPYLVMELVAAPTLRQRLDQGIDLDELARIVGDVARALDALHAAGLVHNDVKPDNIFAPPDGPAKLADLGAARLTGAWSRGDVDAVFGTPLYMAPEYARGGSPGPRADVYSLACVLYEALAGHTPFTGTTAREVLVKHIKATPPPLATTPARLARACMWGLAKSPDERPGSAGELATEVNAAVAAARFWRSPWKR